MQETAQGGLWRVQEEGKNAHQVLREVWPKEEPSLAVDVQLVKNEVTTVYDLADKTIYPIDWFPHGVDLKMDFPMVVGLESQETSPYPPLVTARQDFPMVVELESQVTSPYPR